MTENVVWHHHKVTKAMRSEQKRQTPCLIWFTGLSGSGKSTLAGALEQTLFEQGYHSYLLDGDNVRHGMNKDLGFSDKDRVENIRRIGEMSKLFVDAGMIAISAFISPFKSDRQMVRSLVEHGEFIEVFMDTPITTCEERDPKGLYKKARAGQIKNFTGIDSDYEKPDSPEVRVDSSVMTVEESLEQLMSYLREHNFIR